MKKKHINIELRMRIQKYLEYSLLAKESIFKEEEA